MGNTLSVDHVEAANRAMSSLTVQGMTSVIVFLLAFGAIAWAGIIVYGNLVDMNKRNADFPDVIFITSLVFATLMIVAIFISLI